MGMVTYIIEGKKKRYIPTSPEKLVNAAEQAKQREIERYDALKTDLQRIIPQLITRYNSVKEKDLFEVYQGPKGCRAMINEILKEKPPYWKGFGNLQIQEFFPNEFKRWFKNTTFMLFSTKTDTVIARAREARKTTKVKIIWLPKEMYMQIVWTVFGDNLLIIIYEPEMIVLRIKSEQVVKTFKEQFYYLWKKHKQLLG